MLINDRGLNHYSLRTAALPMPFTSVQEMSANRRRNNGTDTHTDDDDVRNSRVTT